MSYRYTKEQKQWLIDNINHYTYKELTNEFNKTFSTNKTSSAIKRQCLDELKIKRGTLTDWDEEKINYLKNNLHLTREELTKKFNKHFGTNLTVNGIKSYCLSHGMLSQSEKDGRFKEGYIPWNKDISRKKWLKHYSKESHKKLLKNLNYRKELEIGDEIIEDGYIYVVINKDYSLPPHKRRKQKHRITWEKAYGEIPEGHYIIFLDGNTMNCDLNNLRCVSNSVMASMKNRNWLKTGSVEITKTAIEYCKLEKILKDNEYTE